MTRSEKHASNGFDINGVTGSNGSTDFLHSLDPLEDTARLRMLQYMSLEKAAVGVQKGSGVVGSPLLA